MATRAITERIMGLLAEKTDLERDAIYWLRLHDDKDRVRKGLKEVGAVASVSIENTVRQRTEEGIGDAYLITADLVIDLLFFSDSPAKLFDLADQVTQALYDYSLTLQETGFENGLLSIEDRGGVPRYNTDLNPTFNLNFLLSIAATAG